MVILDSWYLPSTRIAISRLMCSLRLVRVCALGGELTEIMVPDRRLRCDHESATPLPRLAHKSLLLPAALGVFRSIAVVSRSDMVMAEFIAEFLGIRALFQQASCIPLRL
jgi:hypothetical protein